MITIKKNRKWTSGKSFQVTDVAGNTAIFNSVADIAKAMECSTTHIYNAIKFGKTVLGCKVKVVNQPTNDNVNHDIIGVDV